MHKLSSHFLAVLAALPSAFLILAKWSEAAPVSHGPNTLYQGGETCASAFPIFGVPFADAGITGLLDHCPGTPFNDVFYQFIAPVSGLYTASTCGSPSQMTIRAWQGGTCCFPGVPLPASDFCQNDPFLNGVLHISLSAGELVFIEVGSASPSAPPHQPYSFSLIGSGGGGPVIQINQTEVEFPPTHVGSTSVGTVLVTNAGNADLTVIVNTNGYIWSVSPPIMQLSPGQSQPVTLAFSPAFEHSFVGAIEFASNDPLHPLDSVRVSGDGCPIAIAPPPPIVRPAGSPSAAYVAIPWDQNGQSTQYAVEFSDDNFATSNYMQMFGGNGPDTAYATASFWGHEGPSAITGLDPGRTYQVRLHARDCTGYQVIGPVSGMTTPPEVTAPIHPDSLVIQVVSPDSLQLSWSQPRTGSPVPWEVANYAVWVHATPSDVGHVVAHTQGRSIRLPLSAGIRGFYTVIPDLTGNYDQPSPFIAWPPNGAVLCGVNSIVIGDYLHSSQWDSFRVMVGPQPVGSNLNNPWGETNKRAVSVNFAEFGTGPMPVTVTVVDHHGRAFSNTINVMVQTLPRSSFTPQYIAATQTVLADTAGYVPPSLGGIVDFLWEGSLIDERYGHVISFPWETRFDSLVVLHCIPIPSIKILSESPNWFADASEVAGVKPVVSDPAVPFSEIACCCDNLELRTSGTTNGVYSAKKNLPLGPIVRCNAGTGEYTIAFAFEVEVTMKYKLAPMSSDCSWGQNCKRTSITVHGACDSLDNFVPAIPAVVDTDYKNYGGHDYPRDGAAWGNDDYRPDSHGATQDQSQQIKGKIRWYDWPARTGVLGLDEAIRDHRRAMFSARVDPQCVPLNIICCQTWELEWDVTICPNCVIHQTIPPNIFNYSTPAVCPALAPN